MSVARELGNFLKDRRLRLDPASLGFTDARRRTAGLRREEIAQRANISTTWYTFLEQGRGGPPSADVLDRVSRALLMTEAEREHAFVLGLGRLPDLHYKTPDQITPRLQKILDAMEVCPALVRTATWDIVAWNRAAALVFVDYGQLPLKDRNALRLMFLNPAARAAQPDWEMLARFVVAIFRADAARAGASRVVEPLVKELSDASPEFAQMWHENDVGALSEGVKILHHPDLGPLGLEYSSFGVEGRHDLTMLVYTPAKTSDAQRIQSALVRQPARGDAECRSS